ncbi:MAG: hypothetical protein FJX77_14140, partial [Armatimonadetes bacterium]|nr:hypothetical protein [Armatimonadota bacterium]
MARHIRWILGAVLCAVAFSAQAANSRVTVTVENATAAQAVQALGTAAGVPLALYQPPQMGAPRGDVAPAPVKEEPRASFRWNNISLGKAMRELAKEFHLRPSRAPEGGYMFYPSFEPPPGPQRPVGAFEQSGVRIIPTHVSISDYRQRSLENAGVGDSSGGGLSLNVRVEWDAGDAEALQGFTRLSARDELGNVYRRDERDGSIYYNSYNSSGFPDEWRGTVSLPVPHPKAKKLVWIEGDLMAASDLRRIRVELPTPEPKKSVRKDVSPDCILHLSRFRAAMSVAPAAPEPEEEEEDPNLPQVGFGRRLPARESGPEVQVRVYTRRKPNGELAGLVPSQAFGYGAWPPVAIGASGKSYRGANTGGSRGTSNGDWQLFEATYTFMGMKEPVVRFAWDLVERGRPIKVCSFRLTNVPLPDVSGLLLNRPNPVPPPAPKPPTEAEEPTHPFYLKGGPTLTSRVLLLDRPAEGGLLMLGLAARAGTGWGPTRWTELNVDNLGTARLEG